MSALVWDQDGQKTYEVGVDHGVLYKKTANGSGYGPGVAWNGLTNVSESPSGAEPTALYADNIKYLNLMSAEEFGGTIEAYTYPSEFAECDGSAEPTPGVYIGQQNRKGFGLCYRTRFGNDQQGHEYGYKLHLVYNCLCSPSEKSYETINDSPDAITFSWEFSTTPTPVTDHQPTACIVIDSTKVDSTKLQTVLDKLYGSANSDPELPSPDWVISTLS